MNLHFTKSLATAKFETKSYTNTNAGLMYKRDRLDYVLYTHLSLSIPQYKPVGTFIFFSVTVLEHVFY